MGNNSSYLPYCVPVPDQPAPRPDDSQIYRNRASLNNLPHTYDPKIQNLQQLYLTSFDRFGNLNFLGTRRAPAQEGGAFGPYKWRSYREVSEICKALGSAVIGQNLAPKLCEYNNIELRMVGLWSKNREEWVMTDIANQLYGVTSIPIYDTLGPEAVRFVFEQTNLTTVFMTANYVASLAKETANGKTNRLRNIVVFDPENLKPEARTAAEGAGLVVLEFWKLVESGKNALLELPTIKPTDISTFSYTSGTTGIPKAAMLSHGNFVANVVVMRSVREWNFTQDTVYLSYLPLAHVMEKVAMNSLASAGASVGFYNGDVFKLKADLQELRPTVLASVPRLLTRFHDLIRDKLDKIEGTKGKIIKRAIETKLANLRNNGSVTHFMYDKCVFNKVREEFGGRITAMVTGSAPISKDVLDFLKIAFCCPITEGYGQTETMAASFLTAGEDPLSGHVGGPTLNVEFKIRSVAEMNYLVTDKDSNGNLTPRGEIMIRGPTIIPGYYKDPEKTREAIDEEGWIATGDIVSLDPQGRVKIIDRKKNIFKLQQGEYVAPEKIENIYKMSKYIAEAFVHGDSLKSHLVGVFVPNKDPLEALAKQHGIEGEFAQLCENEKLKAILGKELDAHAKKEQLFGFECVKVFHLDPTSFVLQGLCTPSLKMKRVDTKKHYLPVIEKLYTIPVGDSKK